MHICVHVYLHTSMHVFKVLSLSHTLWKIEMIISASPIFFRDLPYNVTMVSWFFCLTLARGGNITIFWGGLLNLFFIDIFFIYISNYFPFSGSPLPASSISPLPSRCSSIYPFPLSFSGIPLYSCIESFQNQGPLLHSF